MKVWFVLVDLDNPSGGVVIKKSNYDHTVLPFVCSNIRLDNGSYFVLSVDYNYDSGVITVNLKNI